jgi:hypothetical protein
LTRTCVQHYPFPRTPAPIPVCPRGYSHAFQRNDTGSVSPAAPRAQ